MRLVSLLLIGAFALLSTVVDENSGTLMLSSILMALKSGYWAGKLGMGGLFAMMAAKNYEQQRVASGAGPSPTLRGLSQLFSAATQAQAQTQAKPLVASSSRKRFRYTRSVNDTTPVDFPVTKKLVDDQSQILPTLSPESTNSSINNSSLPLNVNNGTKTNEKPLSNSNKTSMTEAEILRAKSLNRVVRQLGVLERLSCLPKLLCGLETKEPSTKTTALNDYGALVKLLFGREDDAEVDDDEEEDDDGRTALDTDSDTDPDPDSDNADPKVSNSPAPIIVDDGPVIGSSTIYESLDDHHLPPTDVDDESVKQMAAVLNSGKRNKYRVNKNRHTKTKTTTTQKPKNNNKDDDNDDSDESGADDDKSGEAEDYTEFDEMGQGVLNWRDMAQDELMNDEPELLTYALMELREELKQKKEAMDKERAKLTGQPIKPSKTTTTKDNQGRHEGAGQLKNNSNGSSTTSTGHSRRKNQKKRPSHSSTYRSPSGGGNVKYQVISPGPSSMVQSPYDPYPIQYPESYVPPVKAAAPGGNSKNIIDKLNKNIRNKFGFGFASDRPQSGTVLETLLPSSIYNTFKSYLESEYEIPPIPGPGASGGTSKNGFYHRHHQFSDNPYLRFPRTADDIFEDGASATDGAATVPNEDDLDGGRDGVAGLGLPQRINSKFRRLEGDQNDENNEVEFMARKSRQLENAGDPLTKYRVALETGHRTKSARQCRLLFSRCPYKYSEIKQLIDNAKEFLDSTATVGDKVVPLKKKGASKGTSNRIKGKPGAAGGGGSGIVAGSLDADSVVQLLGPLAAAAAAAKRANKTASAAAAAGASSTGTSTTMGMGALSTFVMQQLPNGDFEIKLKVKPKHEMVQVDMGGVINPVTVSAAESAPASVPAAAVAPAAATPAPAVPVEKIEEGDPKPILVNGTLNGVLNSTFDDLWRLIETSEDKKNVTQLKINESTTTINTNRSGGTRFVELKSDKAFAPTGKKHDLMGIDYPPEPPVLAPVAPAGHIPDLYRAAVFTAAGTTGGSGSGLGNLGRDLDGGSSSSSVVASSKEKKKVRPPAHHLLPPRPSTYKIIRKRVGRPRREDYDDE